MLEVVPLRSVSSCAGVCESVMTHRGVETESMTLVRVECGVMTTEAVTALASAAVITIDNNYARRWNTIGCEE